METRSKTAAKRQQQEDASGMSFLGRLYRYNVGPLLTMTVTQFLLMFIIYFNLETAPGEAQLTGIPAFFRHHFKGNFQVMLQRIASKFVPTQFGLSVVGGVVIFEALLTKCLPGPTVKGQPSAGGFVPIYRKNGILCYLVAMSTLGLTIYLSKTPSFAWKVPNPIAVLHRYDEIIGAGNAIALASCVLLYVKAALAPNSDCIRTGYPLYDFMWGVELFPRIFGVDLKYFLNCRVGMLTWPMVVALGWYASYQSYGFQWPIATSSILQLGYLTKFFLFEETFYTSVDNLYDRGGYYIAWGCLTFMPALYHLPTQYLAVRPGPTATVVQCAIPVLVVGFFFLITQRLAEADKAAARASKGERSVLGGKPTVIRAKYRREHDGKEAETVLLVSGFWRISRHYTYLAESGLAFCWCLATGFNSALPYFYFLFLLSLFIFRSFKDDDRCAKKYGKYWTEYTDRVRYRIFPFIF